VGPRGTVAHFGGDQFAVLLEDVASIGDAVRVARRIEEGLRRPLDLGGLERAVTTSIGIGLSTSKWEPPGEIVRCADAAMYRAKEAGVRAAAVMTGGAFSRAELEEAGAYAVYEDCHKLLETGFPEELDPTDS
jgi:GGDEF domain-containing protein